MRNALGVLLYCRWSLHLHCGVSGPLRVFYPQLCAVASIFVCQLQVELLVAQLAVLGVAVRDCLLANGFEILRDACCLPMRLVPQADLHDWLLICFSPFIGSDLPRVEEEPVESRRCWSAVYQRGACWYPAETCTSDSNLSPSPVDGPQSLASDLASGPQSLASDSDLSPSPWQTDPPLPEEVSIDLSNHLPKQLRTPEDVMWCSVMAEL